MTAHRARATRHAFALSRPAPTAAAKIEVLAMPAPDAHAVHEDRRSPPVTGLEKVLRGMSAFTMLMTLPQVSAIWVARDARSVSLVSWSAYLAAACLWFVYGVRKRDKTIWVACIGWILLDAAIVAGVLIYG